MSAASVRLEVSDPRDQGRPIVFVHGFAHNRFVWEQTAESLSQDFRPYLVDLRGHGDSDWSINRAYSLDDYAGDLLPVFDRLGLRRATVVAHSLGGLAAALFAASNPERVEALVLVDSGPSLSVAASAQIASDASDGLASFDSPETHFRWLRASLPTAEPAALARFAERSVVRRLDGRFEVKLDPGVVRPANQELSWRYVEERIHGALRKIACPTLLIRGGLSSVLSEQAAREMTENVLTDGCLKTLERAGHAVMLDDAPALVASIEGFLEGLAR